MASSPSLSPARRREIARGARDAFPSMGVYCIRNVVTRTVRVAASRNVPAAINRTRFELQRRGCRNVQLQQEFDRHGADALVFEVLELVEQRDDPSFDYAAELDTLLQLWTGELATAGGAQ